MADEVKGEEVEKVFCKRCGAEISEKPLSVDEGVMEDYLRAVLGGKHFERTFKLASGRISMTFAEIPGPVSDKFNDIMKTTPVDKALDTAVNYKLALILKKVEFINPDGVVEIKYEADDETRAKYVENLQRAFSKLSESFDESILVLLRRAGISFIMLTKAISDSLLNSDFYTGVGLR